MYPEIYIIMKIGGKRMGETYNNDLILFPSQFVDNITSKEEVEQAEYYLYK